MSNISAASRLRNVAPFAMAFLLRCAIGLGQNITQFDVRATEGIALGPDGAMWFTDLQFGRIGRIDANGAVTTFSLQGVREPEPEGIALGLDGNLWSTEISPPGRIGRITTSGVVTEFTLPGS